MIGLSGPVRAWLEAYRQNPHARVLAVFDEDPELASKMGAFAGAADVHGSLDEVLTNTDILAVEINLPPKSALQVAAKCLKSGLAVGIRSTAAVSLRDADEALSEWKKRLAFRVFSPAFFSPVMERVRVALEKTHLGDLQTLRIKSVFGRPGEGGENWIHRPMPRAPFLCGPEFEILPLMFLLGEVQTIHAVKSGGATLISWTSSNEPGGARYGVFEALCAPDLMIRSPLEPVAQNFELAGTDGYIFGGNFTGRLAEAPPISSYIRGSFEVPEENFGEDPFASYQAAADDLVEAVRRHSATGFGVDWFRQIATLRDAVRRSLESREEVLFEIESD